MSFQSRLTASGPVLLLVSFLFHSHAAHRAGEAGVWGRATSLGLTSCHPNQGSHQSCQLDVWEGCPWVLLLQRLSQGRLRKCKCFGNRQCSHMVQIKRQERTYSERGLVLAVPLLPSPLPPLVLSFNLSGIFLHIRTPVHATYNHVYINTCICTCVFVWMSCVF